MSSLNDRSNAIDRASPVGLGSAAGRDGPVTASRRCTDAVRGAGLLRVWLPCEAQGCAAGSAARCAHPVWACVEV